MKKFMSLVVLLCLMICTLTVMADEAPQADITWTVEDGILTIKGKGAMTDYRSESAAPWHEKRNEITEIVVEEGVTHIGNMAFYGLKNAKKATIATSVESIGIHAFSYTEGTSTSLGNLSADFQFTLESDSAVVNKGDTFTLTVVLNGDFKNVSAVQTAIVYDKKLISIDSKTCLDEEWLSKVDETNLGYISSPLTGTVANNLRLAYVSLSGVYIDEESPLYNAGKQDIVIAKVNCTALDDIKDISPAVLMIKNSAVALLKDGKILSGTFGENQLTACTRLPLPSLTVVTESKAMAEYATKNNIKLESSVEVPETVYVPSETPSKGITIIKGNETIESDAAPYKSQDGCLMLPLRAIMENMGIAVIWDGETKTIFMATDEDFAAHQLGKTVLFRNETNMDLEHESEAKDSRCFVSPDFFEKSFGIEINLDKDSNTVTVK